MAFAYTPFLWPFLASLAMTAALGAYAWRQRVDGARTFAAVMAGLSLWTLCYTMELSSATLEGKVLWLRLKYLGSTTGPVMWFVFSLKMTGHRRWVRWPLWAALGGWVAMVWAVVFTPLRTWMWPRIVMRPGYPEMHTDHGPFFWVYALSLYGLILLSVVLFFRHYRTAPAVFRRQAALLVAGGFLPLGGRMTEDLLGLDLIPRVDEVIFFFLFSAILFALALFRYGALNLVPVAHDAVVRNLHAGILVLDPLGRLVELNPYAQSLLETTPGEAIGRRLQELRPALRALDACGPHGEIQLAPGGQPRHLSVQRSPIDPGQGDAGEVIILFDITDRKEAERKLEVMAATDPLTGVTNRRFFYELAEAEVGRSLRRAHPLAVVMLDVDHFKRINDRHGHLAGDQVLRAVAAECGRSLRQSDVFARFGGEEFVCLLPETELGPATVAAERLRAAVEAAAVPVGGGPPLRVTVSVGVAFRGADQPGSLDGLLARADAAMYASKEAGRNRVTVWSPAIGGADPLDVAAAAVNDAEAAIQRSGVTS
jgi:diguanylate cyclase (GGDEF)-like protein